MRVPLTFVLAAIALALAACAEKEEPSSASVEEVSTTPTSPDLPGPPQFAPRESLPFCGAESVSLKAEGKFPSLVPNLEARQCLVRAFQRSGSGELLSEVQTAEGPFPVLYRVLPDGGVEYWQDDSFGAQGIRVCEELLIDGAPVLTGPRRPAAANADYELSVGSCGPLRPLPGQAAEG